MNRLAVIAAALLAAPTLAAGPFDILPPKLKPPKIDPPKLKPPKLPKLPPIKLPDLPDVKPPKLPDLPDIDEILPDIELPSLSNVLSPTGRAQPEDQLIYCAAEFCANVSTSEDEIAERLNDIVAPKLGGGDFEVCKFTDVSEHKITYAVAWNDDHVLICFQGTHNDENLALYADDPETEDVNEAREAAGLPDGFHRAIRKASLDDDVWGEIKDLLNGDADVRDGKDVMVTGHSLGGALAGSTLWNIQSIFRGVAVNVETLVTFGAPRYCDFMFGLNIMRTDAYSVENKGDEVPQVDVANYVRVGELVEYDFESPESESWDHHRMQDYLAAALADFQTHEPMELLP